MNAIEMTIAAAALFTVFCHCLTAPKIDASHIFVLLFTACCALTLESIQLPFIFGIGPEKGRLLFTLLMVFSACAIYSIPEIVGSISQFQLHISFVLILPAIAFALLSNLLSFQISKSIYRRKI